MYFVVPYEIDNSIHINVIYKNIENSEYSYYITRIVENFNAILYAA